MPSSTAPVASVGPDGSSWKRYGGRTGSFSGSGTMERASTKGPQKGSGFAIRARDSSSFTERSRSSKSGTRTASPSRRSRSRSIHEPTSAPAEWRVSDKPRLRVLIVDDEPLARQRLEDLLRREPRMEIVGRIDNGPDAVDAIRSLKPDLVFLDVQMPGKTGLDVVAEIGVDAMPPTIFVTAYHQHALKAFELAAVDYLVKPFDDERFIQALRRAEKLIDLQQVEEMTERLRSLLGGRSGSTPAPTKSEYAERIAVESRGQVRVIPVEKI